MDLSEQVVIEEVCLTLPKKAKCATDMVQHVAPRKSFVHKGVEVVKSSPKKFSINGLDVQLIPKKSTSASPKKKISDYLQVIPKSADRFSPNKKTSGFSGVIQSTNSSDTSVVRNSPIKWSKELTVEPIVISMKNDSPAVVTKNPSTTARGARGRKRKVSRDPGVHEQEFEVEMVVGHQKHGDKVVYYQVKWKGWPSEQNTWEPLDNLRTSLGAVADYYQERVYPGRGQVVLKSHVENLREQLAGLDEKAMSVFCFKYLTDMGHSITIDEAVVEENLVILSRIPPFARDTKMVEDVRRQLQLIEFRRKREEQLEMLQTWESEINAISNDKAPVKIYNSVDLEGIPKNFIFVNENVPDFDVTIPNNNPLACECKGSCLKNKGCCWNGSLHDEPPYTKDGILRYDRGTPIYECNKNCKCGPDCGNRVLQKGRTIPMAIFKTSNGCGWGVRTLEPIKKGAFVVEYVGEVIKSDIAEIRGRTYDKNGCTYLFDLDFDSEDDCPYTIDAAIYGNVSHFINHSCEPNLTIFAVWVDCMDSHLPRLGLYANRNIKAFEELSFDYMMEKPSPKNPKKDEGKQTFCQCNAKKCRKLVF